MAAQAHDQVQAPAITNKRAISATVGAGDALLRQLADVQIALIQPLARAAAALAAHEAWRAYGYSSRGDFARERLQRDARWLADLVRLHEATERLPALANAMCGTDGGPPLGSVAVLQISRIATHATVEGWIARARACSLGTLRAAITAAIAELQTTAANAERDGKDTARFDPGLDSDAPRARVFWKLPPDVKLAFESAFELHRAVTGREAAPAEFAQSLAAEAASVPWTPPADFRPRYRVDEIPRWLDASRRYDLGTNAGAKTSSHPQPFVSPTSRSWSPGTLVRSMPGASPNTAKPSTSAFEPTQPEQTAHVRALYTPAMRRALQRLQEFRQLDARLSRLELRLAGPQTARGRRRELRRLGRVLVALRRLEDVLEIAMGDLLLELHEHQAWKELGCAGLEAYAEERLRMGRSTARKRVALARRLRRLAVVRQAYERGWFGVEAAQFVAATLQHERSDSALQALWVEHARTTTVKRLRTERRLHERERLRHFITLATSMTPERPGQVATARRSPIATASTESQNEAAAPAIPAPPDDSAWQQALRLVPGKTRDAVLALGYGLLDRVVRNGPLIELPFGLDLPVDVADELLGSIEAARRQLSDADEDALAPADDSRLRPAQRIARAYVRRRCRVPEWVGLLAVLEEWVLTHDVPEAEPDRRTQRIFERDGYRCMAPGCTSRSRLQVHHVTHRAWGGGQEPENLLVLCLFHHMQGEHGGLARVRGRAPLDLVWRLGAPGLDEWFRNERRLGSAPLTTP